jgi:hypothetical protein
MLAAVGAVGTMVLITPVQPLSTAVVAPHSVNRLPSDKDGRYQLSPHVARYYQTARI